MSSNLPGSLEHRCDAMCAALLRSESTRWCLGDDEAAISVFLDCLRHHGVQCIVYERRALLHSAPPAVYSALQLAALERSAWELREAELLRQVLGTLDREGIQPLLFKGAALAYSLYGNPVWRSRTDTDLLVPEAQWQAATRVIEDFGYASVPESESIIYYQRDFAWVAPEGGEHRIDLHWRINNSEVLSQILNYEALAAQAEPLPRLGHHARRVCHVHALLIAAFHRKVHASYTTERFHWLLDVDLLVRSLQPPDWQRLLRLATDKGLPHTVLDALEQARKVLSTPVPAPVLEQLAESAWGNCDRLLDAGPARRLLLEWRACNSRQARRRYLHRLLPSRDYMLAKYGQARCRWLPWLHLRRSLSGGLKLAGLWRKES